MKERIRKFLSLLPSHLFSLPCFMAILWLTLAPKPLGDEPPPFFPGADKLAHAIMFGGMAITLMFDWQRKHDWAKVKINRGLTYAISSALLGVVIEFLQAWMGMGRGFEYTDMIADGVGAMVFPLIYFYLQNYWKVIHQK